MRRRPPPSPPSSKRTSRSVSCARCARGPPCLTTGAVHKEPLLWRPMPYFYLFVLSSGNIKQMAHFFFLVLIEFLFKLSQKFFVFFSSTKGFFVYEQECYCQSFPQLLLILCITPTSLSLKNNSLYREAGLFSRSQICTKSGSALKACISPNRSTF